MKRRFQTLDVFTDTALTGNPLAVVLDAEGLDDARMQAVAAEFNLSETVFVFEPRNAINSARVRIFTPKRELPFAATTLSRRADHHLRAPICSRSGSLGASQRSAILSVHARRRPGACRLLRAPKYERLEGEPPSTTWPRTWP